jgi:uncharacterized membrane protein
VGATLASQSSAGENKAGAAVMTQAAPRRVFNSLKSQSFCRFPSALYKRHLKQRELFLTKRSPLLHTAYLAAILIKGFDGALEALAGIVIAVTGPERLYEWVIRVTAPELTGHHPALHAIRSGATRLAEASHEFVIFYLLVHGILKLGVVAALLRGGGRWLFPIASLILACFVAYMGRELSLHWSGWVLSFALFDLLTLILVLNEWRNVTSRANARTISRN